MGTDNTLDLGQMETEHAFVLKMPFDKYVQCCMGAFVRFIFRIYDVLKQDMGAFLKQEGDRIICPKY